MNIRFFPRAWEQKKRFATGARNPIYPPYNASSACSKHYKIVTAAKGFKLSVARMAINLMPMLIFKQTVFPISGMKC